MTNRVSLSPSITHVSESIAVINGSPGRNFSAQFPHSFVWKTCLREIAIVDARSISPDALRTGDQLFTREEGYEFLLEVICGLHSPVLGETEVLGQFKKFAQAAENSPGWRCTAPWIQRLIADAKRVRTNHLMGMGSRSYGQLSQARLADCSQILIVGAGHLVQETLPWFSSQEVHVYCRRPEAARESLLRQGTVQIHAMEESMPPTSGRTGLIIAAPMTADEIAEWVHRLGCSISTVVDLRGESATDPLDDRAGHVIHLREILDDLETNSRFTNARVERARAEIKERSQDFWDRFEIRPFGWEDLCA